MTRPKPTALHRLHGTGNATRLKSRNREPMPHEIEIPPPPHLTDEQVADWHYAVKHAPAGVIYACDRGTLEVYIVAADHHRTANQMLAKMDQNNEWKLLVQTTTVMDKNGKQKAGGNIVANPYLNVIAASGARMIRAATELGFTPAARPRLITQSFDPALMQTRAAPSDKTLCDDKNEQALDRLMAARQRLN
jgi:P27 family predicted phage terminase small subunit